MHEKRPGGHDNRALLWLCTFLLTAVPAGTLLYLIDRFARDRPGTLGFRTWQAALVGAVVASLITLLAFWRARSR